MKENNLCNWPLFTEEAGATLNNSPLYRVLVKWKLLGRSGLSNLVLKKLLGKLSDKENVACSLCARTRLPILYVPLISETWKGDRIYTGLDVSYMDWDDPQLKGMLKALDKIDLSKYNEFQVRDFSPSLREEISQIYAKFYDEGRWRYTMVVPSPISQEFWDALKWAAETPIPPDHLVSWPPAGYEEERERERKALEEQQRIFREQLARQREVLQAKAQEMYTKTSTANSWIYTDPYTGVANYINYK